jgi:hypothetical protein
VLCFSGAEVAAEQHVKSIEEVIARLAAIDVSLRPSDGVGCFTRLYLAVTRSVQERLGQATFANPAFLERLDVLFATLYLDAFDAQSASPGNVPHAWAPLFEARGRHGIAPLQFALAGMNAHINRDLPVALVACWRELGLSDTDQADFERVNDVLALVEGNVKQQYLGGHLRLLDKLIHRVDRIDDVVAMWDIRRAREAAWVNAQALWALRGDKRLAANYLSVLDRSVGLASRGLLQPADTWLQRLGRALDGFPAARNDRR